MFDNSTGQDFLSRYHFFSLKYFESVVNEAILVTEMCTDFKLSIICSIGEVFFFFFTFLNAFRSLVFFLAFAIKLLFASKRNMRLISSWKSGYFRIVGIGDMVLTSRPCSLDPVLEKSGIPSSYLLRNRSLCGAKTSAGYNKK